MTPERWCQIEQLYLAAMELDGKEREALLAREGPDVRQKVEAMLGQAAGSNPLWARAHKLASTR